MQALLIEGGRRLSGVAEVSGSKNAALPIMAAGILATEPVSLARVPNLVDVRTMSRLLDRLGVAVERGPNGLMRLETVDASPTRAPYALARSMRASFCVLGPLLARRGRAAVSLPGGCNIGTRPVDLHLAAMESFGADLHIEQGYVVARASRLKGAQIDLLGPCGPTVTGTANALCAAVLARGRTTITSAAFEPEIVDLGRFLVALGASITGLGTPTLEIIGVEQLGGAWHEVIPDRIEAATLLLAAAITGGTVRIDRLLAEHLRSVLELLAGTGCELSIGSDSIYLQGPDEPLPIDVTAEPYPGIPTDLQPQFMALLSVACGVSRIRDSVFPERFIHVAELHRLGAQIERVPSGAIVHGVSNLSGAAVTARDLRASAALVLAGLAAKGRTIVRRIHHLDRGYERLETKLQALGATISRVSDRELVRLFADHKRVALRPAL